jgi:hypothetical protein
LTTKTGVAFEGGGHIQILTRLRHAPTPASVIVRIRTAYFNLDAFIKDDHGRDEFDEPPCVCIDGGANPNEVGGLENDFSWTGATLGLNGVGSYNQSLGPNMEEWSDRHLLGVNVDQAAFNVESTITVVKAATQPKSARLESPEVTIVWQNTLSIFADSG